MQDTITEYRPAKVGETIINLHTEDTMRVTHLNGVNGVAWGQIGGEHRAWAPCDYAVQVPVRD